jgi:L-ascorbate 6-phosphate lactonase
MEWPVPDERVKPVLSGSALRDEIEEWQVPEDSVTVWWLTQASWIAKFPNDLLFLIDPWWRDLEAGDRWGKLLGEFPMTPEEHPEPDVILCTHWHDDHICPVSLPRLAAAFEGVPFIVPNRSVEMLVEMGIEEERIIGMFGDDMLEDEDPEFGHAIAAVPAAHEALDLTEDGSLYLGYIIEAAGVTLFHMGDSQPHAEWQQMVHQTTLDLTGKLDLALLCINGNDNLRHDQAADLVDFLGETLGGVIPMHYGMDPGNTVDPEIFTDEIESRGIETPYLVAKAGQRITFGPNGFC